MEEIGKNLQRQFETLSHRVKYKLVCPSLFLVVRCPARSPETRLPYLSWSSPSFSKYLDPAFEDTRKLCQQLRKSAKDERVLFYYNGHGVSSFPSSLLPLLLLHGHGAATLAECSLHPSAHRSQLRRPTERSGSSTAITPSTFPSHSTTYKSGSEGALSLTLTFSASLR